MNDNVYLHIKLNKKTHALLKSKCALEMKLIKKKIVELIENYIRSDNDII